MKSKIVFLTLFLSSFTFSPALALGTGNEANSSTSANVQQQKEGEIIAWLVAVNKAEIAASNEAKDKKLSPMVKRYARMIHKDHTKNLEETLKLSQKLGVNPIETDAINQMKQKGNSDLAMLKSLNNQQFQIAFINAMVKGHEEVLQQLNQDLNTVSNSEVKQLLEMTRTTVEKHLHDAKMLQKQLASNS